LHRFQLKALERFCREHDLDIQLIDKSISYAENLKYLKGLVGSTVGQLAEAYSKAYEDWERSLDVGDFYAVPEEALGTPLLMVKCWILIKGKATVNVRGYLRAFEKHVNFYGKYIMVKGTPEDTLNIINVLVRNWVKIKVLRTYLRHNRDWQYIPSKGWSHVPT
jgi:hypothetical protein